MKAVILNGTTASVVHDRLLAKLRDDYLLIRTQAVALNPTDAKALASGRGAPSGLSGCDFAGTVLAIGPAVTKSFQIGERVFGVAFGANPSNAEDGAFAEVITAKGDLVMRVPEGMRFGDACTVGVSAITCGQGLVQGLGLRAPGDLDALGEKEYILIYGASSSAGALAAQFASLAGYTVLATCSKKNFSMVEQRGAEKVFDYNDPECAKQIYEYTDGKLKLIFDTIGSKEGIEICMNALSTSPGCRYGTILLNDIPRKDVTCTSSILLRFLGESFTFGKTFEGRKEDFEFAKMWTGVVERLLEEGKLVPHPTEAREGGLEGVLEGLKQVGEGKVSGVKLVYRVGETI